MNVLRSAFLGSLLAGLVGCGTPTNPAPGVTPTARPAATGEGSNKEKIVGTWEVTQSEELSRGSTYEFARDGKLKISMKTGGGAVNVEGTYAVDGDKLTLTMKAAAAGKDETETRTITRLTEAEMVTKDDKGKTDEFKKK